MGHPCCCCSLSDGFKRDWKTNGLHVGRREPEARVRFCVPGHTHFVSQCPHVVRDALCHSLLPTLWVGSPWENRYGEYTKQFDIMGGVALRPLNSFRERCVNSGEVDANREAEKALRNCLARLEELWGNLKVTIASLLPLLKEVRTAGLSRLMLPILELPPPHPAPLLSAVFCLR